MKSVISITCIVLILISVVLLKSICKSFAQETIPGANNGNGDIVDNPVEATKINLTNNPPGVRSICPKFFGVQGRRYIAWSKSLLKNEINMLKPMQGIPRYNYENRTIFPESVICIAQMGDKSGDIIAINRIDIRYPSWGEFDIAVKDTSGIIAANLINESSGTSIGRYIFSVIPLTYKNNAFQFSEYANITVENNFQTAGSANRKSSSILSRGIRESTVALLKQGCIMAYQSAASGEIALLKTKGNNYTEWEKCNVPAVKGSSPSLTTIEDKVICVFSGYEGIEPNLVQNKLQLMTSKDEGSTWSKATTVAPIVGIIQSSLTVDENGRVYLVYVKLEGVSEQDVISTKSSIITSGIQRSSLWLISSEDHGVTWTKQTEIVNDDSVNLYPAITYFDKYLYISWSKAQYSDDNKSITSDIYLHRVKPE